MTPEELQPASTNHSKLPGRVLLAASALEVLALAHHPTVRTPEIAHAVREIVALAHLAAVVHGVIIALMLAIAFGLSEMVMRLGAWRAAMRGGTLAYGLGVLVMTGAAMADGWLIGGVASLPAAVPGDLQLLGRLLSVCVLINQTCANVGAVAMSAGIALWSLELLRGPRAQRLVGVLGCATGTLIVAALTSNSLQLDLHGITLVVLLQTLWGLSVGVLLVRDQI